MKGDFLVFISYFSITICLIIIISAIHEDNISKQSSNMLYSDNHKGFSVECCSDDNAWDATIEELEAYKNFSICLPIEDDSISIRGIYNSGKVQQPPMIWGKYFDKSTSFTDIPTIVVGKEYQKEIYEKNGNSYYKYLDQEYSVAGVMGTEWDSRINHILVVDFKSALRIQGINSEYYLDTTNEEALYEIGNEIYNLLSPLAEVSIILERSNLEKNWISRMLEVDSIMNTMLSSLIICFVLCTILTTSLWLKMREPLIYAQRLCGYGKSYSIVCIVQLYLRPAVAGIIASIIIINTCVL